MNHFPPPGHGHGLPEPPRRPRHVALPPEEFEILALRMLHEGNPQLGVAQIADFAGKLDPTGDLGGFLERECADLPVGLALHCAWIRQAVATSRRVAALVVDAAAAPVVVLPPLPHVILDQIVHSPHLTVVRAGHDLPHDLRHDRRFRLVSDALDGRSAVEQAKIILLDGFFNGALHVRRSVASLLDLRLLDPQVRLLVHYRGRLEADDIALPADLMSRVERL